MGWEYREVDLSAHAPRGNEIDLLNRAGADGWELITIRPPARAVFKRPTGREPEREVEAAATGIAPKYRDPETGQTWSGRGRMANWLAEKIRNGHRLEDFLISG